MGLDDVMDIAASGLTAQRVRMTVTASNIANAETTRTEGGGPYQRRDPIFRPRAVGSPFDDHLKRAARSVEVNRVVVDKREPIARYAPGHPDANAEGFVDYPRVHMVEETANMMSASRAYEANLAVIRRARAMSEAALRIGR